MKRRRHTPPWSVDVDHYETVENISVRGATEKSVLRDPGTGATFIAKLGRRHNDLEVMTEYAIYVVGRSLGVSVADAKIARYQGNLRFFSRYFLDTDGREELVHGMQLFRDLYDRATVEEVLHNQAREQAMFSVQAIKSAFGAHYIDNGPKVEETLFGSFVAMLTHDALIGVQDRHHENWGVIVSREADAASARFAPLYDSARGLFCNEQDCDLVPKYGGIEGHPRLLRYIERARPLVGFSGLCPVGRHFLTHAELIAAVFWAYPNERQRILGILSAYDWRIVRSRLARELEGLCSPRRLSLILTCLRRRRKAIYRAIHSKAA
jgi:hypothetical protein